APQHPHSFPTRRSSDLAVGIEVVVVATQGARIEKGLSSGSLAPAVRRPLDILCHVEMVDLIGKVVVAVAYSWLITSKGTNNVLRSEEHTSELQSRFDPV